MRIKKLSLASAKQAPTVTATTTMKRQLIVILLEFISILFKLDVSDLT